MTMSWADDPPRVSGGAAQVSARAWSDGPDALLDQAPRGLYRIQIRGVGGQELQRRAALFDELADAPVFVCPEIVQDDDVPPAAVSGRGPRSPTRRSGRHWPSASWCASSASDPLGSRRSSSSCPPNASAAGRPRRPPAGPTHATGPSPDSRPIHPQTRAARDLPPWPTGGTRRAWRGRRAGPVPRAADGFLNTYPVRRSARKTLDRWTRCARGTRRLYTRVSSPVGASGVSRTIACITSSTTGDDHPPRLSHAATVPVARRSLHPAPERPEVDGEPVRHRCIRTVASLVRTHRPFA